MEALAIPGAAGIAPLRIVRPQFSFAFQPIVDVEAGKIISYEALVRGVLGEPAGTILKQVQHEFHRFDEDARKVAIELAVSLGIQCNLNLNFLPRSLQTSDAPIRSTLETAARCGLPVNQLVLEVTEDEVIDDQAHFASVINRYRGMGVKVAIDDFGAGYSGLNLLADFQPDMVKMDMKLVRGIESHGPRQSIVRAIVQICDDLGIDILAEGVETIDEYEWFRGEGVRIFQGFFLAKPAFEKLPGFCVPVI